MHCTKEEFLKLATRWDKLGACKLIPVSEKDLSETVGIFCVPKDSKRDRLIINPWVINSRMYSISRSTKELAPGCLLGLLHLAPDTRFSGLVQTISLTFITPSLLVMPELSGMRSSMFSRVTNCLICSAFIPVFGVRMFWFASLH